MSIWWHDNFCPFQVVNFYVQKIHSSTEVFVLWVKYQSEPNTAFTFEWIVLSEYSLYYIYFLPVHWAGGREDVLTPHIMLRFDHRLLLWLQHGQASPVMQVCMLRPQCELSQCYTQCWVLTSPLCCRMEATLCLSNMLKP